MPNRIYGIAGNASNPAIRLIFPGQACEQRGQTYLRVYILFNQIWAFGFFLIVPILARDLMEIIMGTVAHVQRLVGDRLISQ
ncbi:MAG: hypothetical protein ACI915_003473 [Gammaproteobacteria bacterium]|jgi:hypothetical protein